MINKVRIIKTINNFIEMHFRTKNKREGLLVRQISSEPSRKGKKHYWGDGSGDYGFYREDDKKEIIK